MQCDVNRSTSTEVAQSESREPRLEGLLSPSPCRKRCLDVELLMGKVYFPLMAY